MAITENIQIKVHLNFISLSFFFAACLIFLTNRCTVTSRESTMGNVIFYEDGLKEAQCNLFTVPFNNIRTLNFNLHVLLLSIIITVTNH